MDKNLPHLRSETNIGTIGCLWYNVSDNEHNTSCSDAVADDIQELLHNSNHVIVVCLQRLRPKPPRPCDCDHMLKSYSTRYTGLRIISGMTGLIYAI